MFKHILRSKKDVGDLPKKLTETVPMEYFKSYFQYIVFGLNKILRIDGTMNAWGGIYIISLDIQDILTNVGYDFVTHITNMIHIEIVGA